MKYRNYTEMMNDPQREEIFKRALEELDAVRRKYHDRADPELARLWVALEGVREEYKFVRMTPEQQREYWQRKYPLKQDEPIHPREEMGNDPAREEIIRRVLEELEAVKARYHGPSGWVCWRSLAVPVHCRSLARSGRS